MWAIDIRRYTCSIRVIAIWNSLPQDIVDSWQISCSVKNKLDNYLIGLGYYHDQAYEFLPLRINHLLALH